MFLYFVYHLKNDDVLIGQRTVSHVKGVVMVCLHFELSLTLFPAAVSKQRKLTAI